jgi:hypothetical protein
VRRVYLGIAVIGLVVPAVIVAVFLAEHGLDVGEFADQLFGTKIATLAFADLAISAVAFWAWLAVEGRRIGVARWPFVVATLLVGLCFALPLFLYVREGRLAAEPARAG